MPPKAVVTEAAPNVYRDSLLGLSLETATRELIANQGLPSDFREIVMKEFDAQVALQFSQLATKRKWSISGDISTYKNNIFWQINCLPVKVTLFGEPAQEAVNGIQMISYEKRDP